MRPQVALLIAALFCSGCTANDGSGRTSGDPMSTLVEPTSQAPAPSQSVPSSAEPTSDSAVTDTPIKLDSCQDLLDAQWEPPPGDPDFTFDPATMVAVVTFTDERYRFDLSGDTACFDLPGIGNILQHIAEGR